jgi:hypothetical protein
MRAPIALSKTKLLSFAQCPKRVWLETYSPELEEPSGEHDARLETGERVGAIARELYGGGTGHLVSFDRGLRAAIEQTRALIGAGGTEPIFEATFDHDGVSVRVDVLDRSDPTAPRIVEVKSSTRVKEHHLDDCAVQAYVLGQVGLAPRAVAVATVDTSFVYAGDGRYEGLLTETDVTDAVRERAGAIGERVVATRATLASLDEPAVAVGPQCAAPFACQFLGHCAPASPARAQPAPARGRVAAELTELVRSLAYPRYYLDFETVATAVPLFAGTRPYEALPFQWSCHVETAPGKLEHHGFLDLTGTPPMRGAAESLIEKLGTAGPILVYTSYERRVLGELAARFPDLAAPLGALIDRLVDLHPPTREHYEHPALGGSWSLKAVLPTVAPDLDYAGLGEVRDGLAAQAAYLEASAATTSAARRTALEHALVAYCRQDTLALVRLVEFFARGA